MAIAEGIDAAPPSGGASSAKASPTNRSCHAAHRCYRIQEVCATGYACSASAMNASGQVTGWMTAAGGESHAFLWNPVSGELRDIGTLGGNGSIGRAINNKGQIIGDAADSDGNSHAFFWDPATNLMDDLGTLGGANSSGVDINEAGQIAGTSDAPGDVFGNGTTTRAFFWDPGTREMRVIEPLLLGTDPEFGSSKHGVGYSNAVAINNAGRVAGYWDGAPFPFVFQNAFFWDPQTGQRLSSLSFAWAWATGINDSNQVIVVTQDHGGGQSGFRWDTAHATNDHVGEGPTAINEAGQVAGWSEFPVPQPDGPPTYVRHSSFWDPTQGIVDLGTLGSIGAATFDPSEGGMAINNAAEVTGTSMTAVRATRFSLARRQTLGSEWFG